MNRKKKVYSVLKTFIIMALMFSAGYIAFAVPEAAETFMPIVETIRVEPCEYKPYVSARGTIVKRGESFFAVAAVNEADISQVETGQSVILSGAAFPDGSYFGSVSNISDTAYISSLSALSAPETVVDVTVAIESGDTSELRSGYSVTVQLKTGEERILNMLPYSAVCQDDKGEFVYVLSGSTAVRQDIVTGMEMSDKTEIVSGISEEDLVLSEPELVYDGGRVRTGARVG
ncbi:MAG: efflux RND transporter periplasmic adaptor subunit [Bacteroides sp.]|nr:efflux RND transporter periplasmic adaptor subunit [Bacteroides sp.]